VCFVTGEPSGLTVTLPKALAELKKTVPQGTRIMPGFDRGGAYSQVFAHCREQQVHWVTYRRAPLAVPSALPVITAATIGGRQRTITWAEEKVQLKDYGEARQLTLFEHGKVALQILTSDFEACPADILAWLKSRWREENFKYAAVNYGIDKISPTRTPPSQPRTPRSPRPSARRKLQDALAARDGIPAKLPANQIDPEARTAVLRAGRRGLQMVLRLLAHNAEHWLATHLNAYLRDDDEYRALTRETIIRGLAGTITYTSEAVTIELQAPAEPRIARALALLTSEITPRRQPSPATPGRSRTGSTRSREFNTRIRRPFRRSGPDQA
jgi:hypothetical protein